MIDMEYLKSRLKRNNLSLKLLNRSMGRMTFIQWKFCEMPDNHEPVHKSPPPLQETSISLTRGVQKVQILRRSGLSGNSESNWGMDVEFR